MTWSREQPSLVSRATRGFCSCAESALRASARHRQSSSRDLMVNSEHTGTGSECVYQSGGFTFISCLYIIKAKNI